MDDLIDLLNRLYARFNARDIDGVLSALAEDVAWANAMEGGHVQGRQAVRDYWTRQWAIVSPRVEPVQFERVGEDAILAEVRQTVFGLDGRPLSGQTHGLKDKTVGHLFHFRDGRIVRFDVPDAT